VFHVKTGVGQNQTETLLLHVTGHVVIVATALGANGQLSSFTG
jgi:hypothetical protein